MSKSLNARCIRRWEVEFKGLCDSRYSPYWRKRDLRGYIRECALTTADCMVDRTAEDMARMDRTGSTYGWSPEFAEWYSKHSEEYKRKAYAHLCSSVTTDEIDEEIQGELEAWND
ncbi:hypothetical protein [Enterobacter asburiae]|uniref:hypothetical protein n=1 Tax=Enterobacter asburiae TaxID=61645 RepID=UPI00210B7B84|nr:hypothetical protein [Enterobacter asburiae]MCQ4368926.1 hypothetical protein [Enterobacter asburiae]HDC4618159.1 hypothetical protein [Enterobacter asburiae]